MEEFQIDLVNGLLRKKEVGCLVKDNPFLSHISHKSDCSLTGVFISSTALDWEKDAGS